VKNFSPRHSLPFLDACLLGQFPIRCRVVNFSPFAGFFPHDHPLNRFPLRHIVIVLSSLCRVRNVCWCLALLNAVSFVSRRLDGRPGDAFTTLILSLNRGHLLAFSNSFFRSVNPPAKHTASSCANHCWFGRLLALQFNLSTRQRAPFEFSP